MHLFLSFANLLPCVFCLSRTEIARGRETIFSICFIRSMPEFPLHTKNWSLELIFPGQVLVPYTPECQMVGVVRRRKRKQRTFHFSRRGVEQHRTLYSGHSWNVWKCYCNYCQVLQLILCICTPVVRLEPSLVPLWVSMWVWGHGRHFRQWNLFSSTLVASSAQGDWLFLLSMDMILTLCTVFLPIRFQWRVSFHVTRFVNE